MKNPHPRHNHVDLNVLIFDINLLIILDISDEIKKAKLTILEIDIV